MRRYVLFSSVVLLVAAFVAAWVNAQEVVRRVPRQAATSDGGDYVPQAFAGSDEAAPLEPVARPINSRGIVPVAAPAEEEPEEAESVYAPPRGSRLGPTVLPVAGPAGNVDGELNGQGVAPTGMPSVLKKKAGSPPSAALKNESRLTPTLVGDEPTGTGSSRRATPALKPQPAPRTAEVSANSAAPQVAPQMLQIGGASPRLSVVAVGSKAVTVGKSAPYTIRVTNDSNTAAEGVQVRIALPAWVQVKGGEGSRGEARQEKDAQGRAALVWSIDSLAGGSKEQLALELIVTQNQPFELAVDWSCRPTALVAEVAVHEPQMEVRLEGPSDMLFGEQKTFTLLVSNPGTGDAENVVVDVASGGQPNRLEVGTLAAGQQKQITFSVAASSPGEMEIRAVASGAGGLSHEAASRVQVHKADLQVAVEVAPLQFAGAELAYQVAVANVGDAIAEQVTVSIALPTGAKYLGGLDGAAKAGDGLTLKVGNLAAGSEKVFEIRCVLMQAGENHFSATAHGKGDLLATNTASAQVEALADLKLQVTEPQGPVAVGGDATYEVRIANRGTKGAEKVKVVMQFAQGIEPLEAIGGVATITNGQAIFEPLLEIAAGKETLLKVKVKGEQPGSHAFRVEVKTGDPETKLVSEGVTRCFADTTGGRATARKPGALTPTPATKIR